MRRVQVITFSLQRRQSEKEHAALETKCNQTACELESTRKSLDEAMAQCVEMKKERETLEVELKVKASTIDKIKADMYGMQGKASEAEIKLRSDFEKVESTLRADMTKAEAELAEAKKKIEEAMLRAVSEAKERKRAEVEKVTLEKKGKEQEAQMDEMRAELESRSQEVEVVKVETLKAQRSAATVVQNMGGERGRLASTLEEAWAMVGPLGEEVRVLKEELAARKAAEITKVQAAMRRSSEGLSKKNQDVLMEKNSSIERLISELEEARQSSFEQMRKLREEISLESSAKLEELEQKFQEVRQRAETVSLVNKAKDRLSEQLKVREEEVQLLEQQIQMLKTNLRDLQDQALLRAHQDAKTVEGLQLELRALYDVKVAVERDHQSTKQASELALASKQSEISQLQQQLGQVQSHETGDVDKSGDTGDVGTSRVIASLQVQVSGLQDELASTKANAIAKLQEATKRVQRAHREKQGLMHISGQSINTMPQGGQGLIMKLERCKKLGKLLEENLRRDMLQGYHSSAASVEASFRSHDAPHSTIGIMFDGKGTIESLLIGGPAHASRRLRKGDRVSDVDDACLHAYAYASIHICWQAGPFYIERRVCEKAEFNLLSYRARS